MLKFCGAGAASDCKHHAYGLDSQLREWIILIFSSSSLTNIGIQDIDQRNTSTLRYKERTVYV